MNQTPEISTDAFWHRESYDRFVNGRLPQLLAARLPLTFYEVTPKDDYRCTVRLAVSDVEANYDLFMPDETGLFTVDDAPFVVVPLASSERLDEAEIRCVGEQLYDYVESRLGVATQGLPWDESLVRAWLPLDAWVREVVASGATDPSARWTTGQPLDTTNGIASKTHLRRLLVPAIDDVVTPGQFGRACPFEVPEGPNIGRVYSIALGAAVRDGRLVAAGETPLCCLGLTASMVPFLERNDANRQTLGVNMMRQWVVPPDPEPALVQTGYEPDGPGIWCGRNLLTAFVSSGADNYEDAVMVSESCARRLDFPHPLQPGDKLSNRHGTKGVVSRIVPDNDMPCLPDGTPVEIVYSFLALHTRANLGQLMEAAASRIARAEGQPMIVPPFASPDEAELRRRLAAAGLPEDGMEVLTVRGEAMAMPSTVGWVYWGKTNHLSAYKIHAVTTGPRCNYQGEGEYYPLRDLGCFNYINSLYNTCSDERPDAEQFVTQVERGPVEQSGPPTPRFADVQRRLAAAGIDAELSQTGLSLKLAPPSGKKLKLAVPTPHTWLRGKSVTEVGVLDDVPGCAALIEANAKLQRMMSTGAPASLVQGAESDLQAAVRTYFDSLLTPEHLRFGNRIMFSGRTVLAPGANLRLDQVGLADEIAWTIFGPLIVRELGDRQKVADRTGEAARALDEIMARSWVVLSRAPVIIPTAMMAFHPVRVPDPVIRLHPLVCFLMNADFDGDQAAVFLPVTDEAQKEVAEKLSFAGHLARDPDLYGLRFLTNEALWGLARLSLRQDGRDRIGQLAGVPVGHPGAMVDRESLAAAMAEVMRRDGVEAVIEALQQLMDEGLGVASRSGASMSPFIGSSLPLPPVPETDDRGVWEKYLEEVDDLLMSRDDYSSPEFGPQLLAVKCGARGSIGQLRRVMGPKGLVEDAAGRSVTVRRSFREGLTPEESFACVAGARRGLARIADEISRSAYGVGNAAGFSGPQGFGVLARAMRASHPGSVFARAAAAGEVDPLTDLDSRLFVGLGPE